MHPSWWFKTVVANRSSLLSQKVPQLIIVYALLADTFNYIVSFFNLLIAYPESLIRALIP